MPETATPGRDTTMKTKKTTRKKASATVKDLKPRKNPKGGLPAIQKVRESAARIGS